MEAPDGSALDVVAVRNVEPVMLLTPTVEGKLVMPMTPPAEALVVIPCSLTANVVPVTLVTPMEAALVDPPLKMLTGTGLL